MGLDCGLAQAILEVQTAPALQRPAVSSILRKLTNGQPMPTSDLQASFPCNLLLVCIS